MHKMRHQCIDIFQQFFKSKSVGNIHVNQMAIYTKITNIILLYTNNVLCHVLLIEYIFIIKQIRFYKSSL